MMDMRISTSGLRDSLPPPREHHESQLFYQWALTFCTQQHTQHGLPTTSMIDSQRDPSIEGERAGRTKDWLQTRGHKREKGKDFFKAINQFIHLLLQSRGSIMPTKGGTMGTGRSKQWMNELIQGVDALKYTGWPREGERWRKGIRKKRKVGGQAGAHNTGQIEVIRERGRIISLPENSLMMPNWLRRWN